MTHIVLTVAEILGYVVLYVILFRCLKWLLQRSKVAHLFAAGITGIVFLMVTLLPEKDMHFILHYMTLVLAVIILLLVVLLVGWLALRVLRSNNSLLQKTATMLLLAAALSFLIWLIVSFMIFNVFLGGHPYLGKVVGDDYYFGQHGKYTRVTPEIWWISFWLVTALHCIPPVCLVSGLLLTWLSRLREKSKSRNFEIIACRTSSTQ